MFKVCFPPSKSLSYPFSLKLPILPIQDVLARAVAEEMQKVYRNELGPEPVPLTVTGEAISEEDVSILIHKLELYWNTLSSIQNMLFTFSNFS